MKAVLLTGVRKVEIGQIDEPKLQNDDDLLLQVDVVGVCGSDMHYFRTGRIGQQIVKFPWIVGHECACTVLKAGKSAKGFKPGDRVAVDPLIYCGQCDQCKAGRVHTCRKQKFLGVPDQMPGSLVERLVMPAKCCFKLADKMTLVQAVMTEPFAIGLYCQRRAGMPKGHKVAILGSGPIGLCVLAALRAAGPCTVHCTDLIDARLDIARRCGADWTGNAGKSDMVAEFAKNFPTGVDWAFEAAGQQETIDQAAKILRPGGTLLIVGIPSGDRISFDMNFLRRKEITVLNIRRQNECTESAVELVGSGKAKLDPMVTHDFTLDQTAVAFDMVADYKDGVVKAMIHLTDRK